MTGSRSKVIRPAQVQRARHMDDLQQFATGAYCPSPWLSWNTRLPPKVAQRPSRAWGGRPVRLMFSHFALLEVDSTGEVPPKPSSRPHNLPAMDGIIDTSKSYDSEVCDA
jgi:hypothetical protein